MKVIKSLMLAMVLAPCFWSYGESVLEPPSSESSTDQTLYFKGVRAFQEKKMEEAFEAFNAAANISPDNVAILYNLGRSAFEIQNYGVAAGAWRRALSINPWFSLPRKALAFLEPELNQSHGQYSISLYEQFRLRALQRFDLDSALGVSLLMLIFLGWLWFKQQRAFKIQKSISFYFLTTATFLVLSLTLIKLYENLEVRATLLPQEAEVHSAPSTEANILFKSYQGLEVLVLNVNDDWVQIEQPGGLSGWVKKAELFFHSGDISR